MLAIEHPDLRYLYEKVCPCFPRSSFVATVFVVCEIDVQLFIERVSLYVCFILHLGSLFAEGSY